MNKLFCSGLTIIFTLITLISYTSYAYADNSAVVTILNGAQNYGCEKIQNCFVPYNAKIDVGGTVVWYNYDTVVHTVTTGNREIGPDGLFDSRIQPQRSFSFDFSKAGSYDYYCKVHPWMTGLVTVTGGTTQQENPPLVKPLPPPAGTNIIITDLAYSNVCAQTNSCYQPDKFVAYTGNTVTWYNQDTISHTVASGDPNTGPNGKFDSGLIAPGKIFSFKFIQSGTFDYYCQIHPWMVGQVTIREQSGNQTINSVQDTTQKIPNWIKHIFIWYGNDQVSENELIQAIKFLVQNGIIKLQ